IQAELQARLNAGDRAGLGSDGRGGASLGCALHASRFLQMLYPGANVPEVVAVRDLKENGVMRAGTFTNGPTNGGLVFTPNPGRTSSSDHVGVTIRGDDGIWYVYEDYSGLMKLTLDQFRHRVGSNVSFGRYPGT
ncbi:hypothetical protein DRN67_03385, partial [Candidatus Micrarchaeota archaeon]